VVTTTDAYPTEYYLETDNERGRKIRAGHRKIANLLLSMPGNGFIKTCVSSRPSNEINAVLLQCPTFRLELLTKEDMESHVRAKVMECRDEATAAEYEGCANAIVENASGVFLWVDIATEILVDGITNGIEPFQLWAKLNSLPSELGGPKGLYMRMLQVLDPEQRAEAWRMFDAVLHSTTHLTPLFMSFAAIADPRSAINMRVNLLSDEEQTSRSVNLKKRLRALGGILEISWDGYVRFMHLTAREFLVRADVRHILTTNAPETVLNANVVLLSAYLMLIKGVHFSHGTPDIPWRAVVDALHYAARAESATGIPQTSLLDSLDQTMESICLGDDPYYKLHPWHRPHWINHEKLLRIRFKVGRPVEPIVCFGNDFMSLAVHTSLNLYLRAKLQNGYKVTDKTGRPLLAYAILPDTVGSYSVFPNSGLDIAMIQTVLYHGSDPNAVYNCEFDCECITGSGFSQCWPSPPSIWQLFLATGIRYSKHHRRVAIDWWEAAKVLLAYGASPTATVWYPGHITLITPHSALYVCLFISMTEHYCDDSLPRLLISKGGSLLEGELVNLSNYARSRPHLITTRCNFLRSFFPSLLPRRLCRSDSGSDSDSGSGSGSGSYSDSYNGSGKGSDNGSDDRSDDRADDLSYGALDDHHTRCLWMGISTEMQSW
jgi:hypothetical protein